jgi:hypothetical protein
MTTPVVHNLIIGESFEMELRVPGENFATATVSVASDPGVPSQEIDITVVLPDTIELKAEATGAFFAGSHDLIVWVQWPDNREALIKAVVVVTPAPDTETITSIIDGGAPGTDFDDETDGGEA